MHVGVALLGEVYARDRDVRPYISGKVVVVNELVFWVLRSLTDVMSFGAHYFTNVE